ncbi:uncharacterized protein (DUF305 family) [Arthrobacter woluwensis]|uniref:DUF305 domain-containing protein n=1 Tax=Arthrobacter woluwensis TaxID=156980 RepID=UPI002781A1FD|nr:DUF305 domain-containing protein [Arthrobacter woluwensis]MDQ0709917.1 uncharacterized protein (DUF305 family) [Arthrobacter woluwensis]
MKKTLITTAAALSAALLLSACSTGSGGSGGDMAGMPGHSMSASSAPASSAGTPAQGGHNAADTMFAAMMIPHHQQALEMSGIVLEKKGLPAEVTALARRIQKAQGPEIATLTSWLSGWGENPADHGGHSMEGMMSAEDLKQLKSAQGTAAARLFLTQMIKHHEGALTMARTESRDGKDAKSVELSRKIVADQAAEIAEMKKLLAGL